MLLKSKSQTIIYLVKHPELHQVNPRAVLYHHTFVVHMPYISLLFVLRFVIQAPPRNAWITLDLKFSSSVQLQQVCLLLVYVAVTFQDPDPLHFYGRVSQLHQEMPVL